MPEDFKQNAALNMMNLFDKNNFPLSIEGDDTENIKFTIVRGTQDVLGQDPASDYFDEPPIKIGLVTRIGNEKISVPMIVKNFHFVEGLNMFSLPCDVGTYSSADLFEDIKSNGGDVTAIYGYSESWPPAGVAGWKITTPGRRAGEYKESFPIIPGKACIVQIEEINNQNNRIDDWYPIN